MFLFKLHKQTVFQTKQNLLLEHDLHKLCYKGLFEDITFNSNNLSISNKIYAIYLQFELLLSIMNNLIFIEFVGSFTSVTSQKFGK
jgi:hypothetical protein